MGSPEFAVPTLEALMAAADLDVVCVVSQPDRPKGRGKRVAPTPVRQRAIEHCIPTLEMSKKNYAEVVVEIAAHQPDFIVVAAFGLILRADLLELPAWGCVNLHPSLLPRYRGVSPVQGAILAGDTETGCTTMLMDEGVDTGDILLARSISIAEEDTAGSLDEKLARQGAPLVIETLRGIIGGTLHPQPQNDDLATHTRMIKKEDGRVDWQKSAQEISCHIRAMTPWPSAYTMFKERRLIILRAAVAESAQNTGRAGEVMSLDPLVVSTGDGVLELAYVKIAGKKEMSAQSFRAGYRVQTGDVLG
jgi:methionyl-tRNA formyltransferase